MRVLPTVLLLVVAAAAPVAAQEQEIRDANLPRELEWELLRMYDGGARRVTGPLTVPADEVMREHLAVSGGPLVVAGRVEGDVAMVGGDVVVERGGSIAGSVTVVGGEVRMADGAEVGGTITAYGEASGSRRYGERDRDRGRDDDRWRDRRYRDRGYADLRVRVGAGYNRVEGLPVMFGPVLETAGPNPLRLEALAIWRTEDVGTDDDRMGYQVELEQFLGGRRSFSVGGTLFSVVDPMDRWQISDLEASLATALFHDDYRDHFDRQGWGAFVAARPMREVEARLEYRQEEYESLPAGDPWTLFNGDDVWRSQPLVAEGDLQLLAASLEMDLRDREDDPFEGWYARASVERPVGGELVRPALESFLSPLDPRAQSIPAAELDTDFTTWLVDLRRYAPVGWRSQLNVRVVGGGSLAEGPLPPQFQHALGGIGSLPGFDTFHADCGARSRTGTAREATFYPAYGCDRFVLGQVEYRGSLSLDFGLGDPDWDDDDWWGDIDIDLDPTWVAFFDVGHGWAYAGDPAFAEDRTTGTLYDVGLGFMLDDLGIYMAIPLNDDVDQEPRFFVRLGRRF